MLSALTIQNYALINKLQVDFDAGLSIITGETGAGKSILLGGLSLVLGQRVQSGLVKQQDKKCVIEAVFEISKYNLKSFFDEADLDYEPLTTIRREILPSGKSRAFVNDTPTTLQTLSRLSEQLIDIHSQHQTLQLADKPYQFKIIDALAKNQEVILSYQYLLKQWHEENRALEEFLANQNKAKENLEYQTFLFQELDDAKLKSEEQEELESRLQKLSHVEEIKQNLIESFQMADNEEIGVRSLLQKVKQQLQKISGYDTKYQDLFERVNSLWLEFDDVVNEIESELDGVDFSPEELEQINDRLQLIYNLQKKHQVSTVGDLLEIKDQLGEQLHDLENADHYIQECKNSIHVLEQKLKEKAQQIRENRQVEIPKFLSQLHQLLQKLEMVNTVVKIDLLPNEDFLNNGMDRLEFRISSNKGLQFEQLKTAASGGEMSRIMLAVKTILSQYSNLPSIVFDEIDTGVSGEVANKMAEIMQNMSENMQVITITHLPQIAAKGHQHYKVFKEDSNLGIHSNIKLLEQQERLDEIAEMLGGKTLSDSALSHAKELLRG